MGLDQPPVPLCLMPRHQDSKGDESPMKLSHLPTAKANVYRPHIEGTPTDWAYVIWVEIPNAKHKRRATT